MTTFLCLTQRPDCCSDLVAWCILFDFVGFQKAGSILIITFFRSSFLNQYLEMCEHSAFLTYTLGRPGKPSIKADMGSITHLALEWLSLLCIQVQEGKTNLVLKNSAIDLECTKDELYQETVLSNKDIDKINKTRTNKDIYLANAKLDYGQLRYGSKVVNKLVAAAYKHFTEKVNPDLPWAPINFKHCWNWTWMTLEQLNRTYDPRFRTVLQPERQFEIEITEDWGKYSYDYMGKKLEGNLVLKGTIDLLLEMQSGVIEVVDYKGLTLDTKLPTPNGWTTMGDVKVGDILFDIDGNQTRVIGKSEVKNKPCYKITFDDTSEVICDDEHLWTLHDMSVVSIKDLKRSDKINVCKPVQMEERELPIDPYVFGLWLGDRRNRSVEICNDDSFCFEEIKRKNYKIRKDISAKATPIHTVYDITGKLRKLGVLHNKHIPEIYLLSSFNQRLDLLRGLMDSGGSFNKTRKQGVFSNCNKRLSQDVKRLLLSLGQRPLLSSVKGYGFGKIVDYYPVSFRPIDINPFLLPRKSNLVDKNTDTSRSRVRYVRKIEQIGNRDTQCIMVDSPTSTFLCTENFIPTHNTGRMYSYSKDKPKTYDMLMDDLQLNFYYYCVRKLYPEYKNVIISIYFVRDGGIFNLAFDDSYLEKTENKLRETFEHIKNNNLPKLVDPYHNDKRCKFFCPFFKQRTESGQTYCDHVHNLIKDVGMDVTLENETYPGFELGNYENPGI